MLIIGARLVGASRVMASFLKNWCLQVFSTAQKNNVLKSGHTTCKSAKKKDWEDKKYLVKVLRGPHKRKYTFLRDILTLRRKAKVRSRVIELVRDMYCRVFDLNISDPQKRYIRPVIYWTCK
uniref:Putative secreted protein n=1 Tax=Ixodes ricinus TaxID=34613 RepID=A0A6B0UNC3_IXORI